MHFALLLSLLLTKAPVSKPLATPKTKKPIGRVLRASEDDLLKASDAAKLAGKPALALCGSELKQVKVQFKDPAADEVDPSEGPMKRFALPCQATWLFFKVPGLKPGNATVTFQPSAENKHGRLTSAPPLALTVGSNSYQLQQEGTGHPFDVSLSEGPKRTLLFRSDAKDPKDGDAYLELAGDLNRDGKLDLLVTAGGSYRSQVLFLSAPKGLRPVQTEDRSGLD